MKRLGNFSVRVCSVMAALILLSTVCAGAGDITIHSSGRYHKDAVGNPMFLIGYYGWAAVPDGYFIDSPARYSVMIQDGMPYKINYIRISLGVAKFYNPPDGSGNATPVPFLYVNGKADLNQWDPVFWDGLRAQCQLAKNNGVVVHVAIFDGVELRYQGGELYGYLYSWWNPSCQTSPFYPNPDFNSNSQIDDAGEFYQLANFNSNTGIGYYQRRLIDKVTTELAGYDNVYYEVGNELLASDSAWYTAVINYIKSKTPKAVTQNDGGMSSNRDGWSQHHADTPAQVKSNVASIVGFGYPAWEDPDGPALSNGNVSEHDLRRAAWYSFAGGAACWGGFTVDFWTGERGFWVPTVTYYRNLQKFIQDSGMKFWNMTPQQSLISNNSVNSCLARVDTEYVAYVLNDASITLNLGGFSGNAYYKTYDPKTAVWSAPQTVAGGGTRTFYKPGGADDWAVYVYPIPGVNDYCVNEPFTYTDGYLAAKPGWSGSATSEIEVINQMVRLSGGAGSKDAIKTTYCPDPGTGYITVNCKLYAGTGGRTIWNLWIDDTQGLNLARWYGTANSARGRIGITANVTAEYTLIPSTWNTIKVKINPAANTSQFFFNGTDIGTLSHASEGSGNIVGRLRLERIDNWEAVGHYLYFDDLSVGDTGADTTPPGPVTNFVATAGNGQNVLTWTNPGSDFTGTMIRFSTAGFPGSPSGGTEIYNSNGTSFTHTGLTNGVTYYYSAFAHDAVPNYASAATASATPVAPPTFCFQDLFSYANGALVGQGGWTGNATASHVEVTGGYIRIWGGPGDYYAQKTVSCGAQGGYIWVRCNVNGETGADTMWSIRFNDSQGRNLARWYGSGTTARGRIGDTGLVTAVQNLSGAWQEIAARINPSANTTEFFFNGVSLGTLSHSSTGAGDLVQQIKMERVNNTNATTQHLYFDDLRVGGS